MYSSPPFPHVQHAQDHTDDTHAYKNIKQWFIFVLVLTIFGLLGLIELVNHLLQHVNVFPERKCHMTLMQQYIVYAVLPLLALMPMWKFANSFRRTAALNPSDTWTTISAFLCTAMISVVTLGLVGWFVVGSLAVLSSRH